MATKVRRPVLMATPPQHSRGKGPGMEKRFSKEEKQQLLDNFDLEIADKIRAFESHLALALHSFAVREESELVRIPRELRSMTLREIQSKWGGSFAGTVQRIQREKLERIERERVEVEEAAKAEKEKEARGKRKRGTPDTSPARSSKNARKDGTTTTGKELPAAGRRKGSGKKGKTIPVASSSKGPSTLPQNHIFNPLLPPTPKVPRAPRRGESLLSMNGSPLAIPRTTTTTTTTGKSVIREFEVSSSSGSSDQEGSDDEEEEEEEDSDDELPDTEAYAAKLEARSQPSRPATTTTTTTTSPSSSSSRKKRGPSLMFRQSLAPTSTSNSNSKFISRKEGDEDGEQMCSVPLKDGRVMSFDPLDLDPTRMEEEMLAGGLDEDEREKVKGQVREEVVKALSARMEKWAGLV